MARLDSWAAVSASESRAASWKVWAMGLLVLALVSSRECSVPRRGRSSCQSYGGTTTWQSVLHRRATLELPRSSRQRYPRKLPSCRMGTYNIKLFFGKSLSRSIILSKANLFPLVPRPGWTSYPNCACALSALDRLRPPTSPAEDSCSCISSIPSCVCANTNCASRSNNACRIASSLSRTDVVGDVPVLAVPYRPAPIPLGWNAPWAGEREGPGIPIPGTVGEL